MTYNDFFDKIHTWDEFLAWMAQRPEESQYLEFKTKRRSSGINFTEGVSLARQLSAFANAGGGLLVYGVETEIAESSELAARVCPIHDINLFKQELEQRIPLLTVPPVKFALRSIGDGTGQGVILLQISRHEGDLHQAAGPGGIRSYYYMRVGSSIRPIYSEELGAKAPLRPTDDLPTPQSHMEPHAKGSLLLRYINAKRPLHIYNSISDSYAPLRFTGAHIPDGTNITGANLNCAEMANTTLKNVNLYQADLVGANFFNADLSNSDLRETRIAEANFDSANLAGADLRGAHFGGAIFRRVNITDVNLDGVILKGDTFDPDVELLAAKWNTLTLDGTTYDRSEVERGNQLLPIGGANLLRFIFHAQEPLTAEEIIAARRLISAFGSMQSGVAILLELAAAGERLIIEARGNPQLAAKIGLLLVQRNIPQQAYKQEIDALRKKADLHTEQLDQLVSLGADIRVRQEKDHILLQDLFSKLMPAEVQFQTKQQTDDFRRVVENAGLVDQKLTIGERLAVFQLEAAERVAQTLPLLLSGLLGYYFDANAIPGGIDGGILLGGILTTLFGPGGEKK